MQKADFDPGKRLLCQTRRKENLNQKGQLWGPRVYIFSCEDSPWEGGSPQYSHSPNIICITSQWSGLGCAIIQLPRNDKILVVGLWETLRNTDPCFPIPKHREFSCARTIKCSLANACSREDNSVQVWVKMREVYCLGGRLLKRIHMPVVPSRQKQRTSVGQEMAEDGETQWCFPFLGLCQGSAVA